MMWKLNSWREPSGVLFYSFSFDTAFKGIELYNRVLKFLMGSVSQMDNRRGKMLNSFKIKMQKDSKKMLLNI